MVSVRVNTDPQHQGQYLYRTPPTLKDLSSEEKEAWDDAQSRAKMARGLILDEQRGRLDQMVEMTYPGQKGGEEFGEEILGLGREL